MKHRTWVVVVLCIFLTALPLTRGEAKPPNPPSVSNPVIVYQCDGGICVANEDGTAAYTILPYGDRPTWGSQGNGTLNDPYKIVFEDPYGVLFVLDLAVVNGVPQATAVVPLPTPFSANRPEVSPLGDLVVSVEYGTPLDRGRVWVTPLPGGDSAPVFQADAGMRIISATWRYDASKIAFTEKTLSNATPPNAVQLCVVDADGSGFQQLTPLNEGSDMEPEWSPVGDRIAFTGVNLPGIHILDLSDGSITRVTTDGGGSPSWSPDGTRLVYCEGPAFHGGYLHVLNLLTGENRLIIRRGASRPRWRN